MAKTMKRPIVLDAANSQFSELPGGQFVDAGAIPLDTSSEGNLLKTTDDGLAVRAADAISSAPENALEVRDGKLYVPDNSATAASLVSTDSGNKLRVGTDDKLFVEQQVVVSDDDGNLLSFGRDGGARLTPNDVLSNGRPNLLRIDPTDNKIILTQEDITPALEAPSRDPGNLIVAGSDGGCYLSVGKLLGKNNTILHEDGAGKLDADLSLRYSAGTGQLDILGHDGATVVSSVVVPTSTSSLRSAYLVDGKPDAEGEAVEGDYYVSIAMQYDGIYDNGAALKFRGRKSTPAEVSFEYIVDDEHSGVWPAAMKAAFLSDNKTKTVSQGEATVITFDDGSALTITWTGLSGVKLSGTASFTPAVGIEQGAYIRMVYLLASTDVSDVYVDVSELVDVYIPGDGITIHGDTISVRPKLDGGVTVGPAGVSVDEEWLAEKVEGQLAAGDGISLSGTTVSVKPKTSGGISVDAGGVSMEVKSASGLTVGTGGLAAVVGDGIAFSETGAIIAKLLENGGLAIKRETGEIYVDFSLLPADMLQEIVRAMVQEGGGLAVDENGQLYVDFSTMPTDKFEALLKSIRVPIWVERTKKFYVDKSTGSDTLDDGRGESESKAFKTIQACVDYITSNYNLNKNNVGIYIAPGVYEESLTLGSFSRTTGYIALIDKEGNYGVTIRMTNANVIRVEGGEWFLRGVVVENSVTAFDDGVAHFLSCVVADGGTVHLEGCDILQEYTGPAPINGSVYMRMLGAYGATSVLQFDGTMRARNNLRFHKGNGTSFSVLHAERGGTIQCVSSNNSQDYVDVKCEGEASYFIYLDNSNFYAIGGAKYLPRFLTAADKSVVGKRYYLILSALCSTLNRGEAYFPGDTAGTLEAGTYCVYQ